VPPNKKWRISNETVSLIHSVISGIWAFLALIIYPQLYAWEPTTANGIEYAGMQGFCHIVPQALVGQSLQIILIFEIL
jgi:hypothetical protein